MLCPKLPGQGSLRLRDRGHGRLRAALGGEISCAALGRLGFHGIAPYVVALEDGRIGVAGDRHSGRLAGPRRDEVGHARVARVVEDDALATAVWDAEGRAGAL